MEAAALRGNDSSRKLAKVQESKCGRISTRFRWVG
jgi:hypothetical protein